MTAAEARRLASLGLRDRCACAARVDELRVRLEEAIGPTESLQVSEAWRDE
jgi:hypothetical protein